MYRRTYDGMVGYIDGYKACFQQFTNYLNKYDADRARLKMEMLVMAVEDVVLEQSGDEPQTDCDHKCIQTEIGCEQTDCPWK